MGTQSGAGLATAALVATNGVSAVSSGAVLSTLATAGTGLAIGAITAVALKPAFPGDRKLMTRSVAGAAAADATAVYRRSEEKEIKSAISSVTGAPATSGQYNCMSQEIHDCKESGDGEIKNRKGDFTFGELVDMAKGLFGSKH